MLWGACLYLRMLLDTGCNNSKSRSRFLSASDQPALRNQRSHETLSGWLQCAHCLIFSQLAGVGARNDANGPLELASLFFQWLLIASVPDAEERNGRDRRSSLSRWRTSARNCVDSCIALCKPSASCHEKLREHPQLPRRQAAMKVASRSLQSVSSSKLGLFTEESAVHTGPQTQLAIANPDRSSPSSTRALTRKTRAAVKAWLDRVFLSDPNAKKTKQQQKKKKKELTRRASTGSLTTSSSHSADRKATNESTTANHDPAALWLQSVPSFSALECEVTCDSSVQMQSFDLFSDSIDAETPAPESFAESLEIYVAPPVAMPNNYRVQDRRGGMIVAGRLVLFTNAAFKRKLRHISQLGAIPENKPAHMHDSHLDVYMSALKHLEESSEMTPLSEWI